MNYSLDTLTLVSDVKNQLVQFKMLGTSSTRNCLFCPTCALLLLLCFLSDEPDDEVEDEEGILDVGPCSRSARFSHMFNLVADLRKLHG